MTPMTGVQISSKRCATSRPGQSALAGSSSDAGFPSLQVRSGERPGLLILDRASALGETHALVCFEDTGEIEDLPLSALRLVELKIVTCAKDEKQRPTFTGASGFSIPKGRSEAERPKAERALK
jgi:hypothetical protein